MQAEIRRGRLGDAEAMAAIAAGALPERWDAQAFRAELGAPGGVAFVAVDPAGGLLGYALGARTLSQLEIRSLAVDEGCRRQGLGRRLLARLLGSERARGARDVFLEVRPSNAAAQELYRSAGFRRCGARPRYYADGEAALVMSVRL